MGNIQGSGCKNLPVSYYCMPGSSGASGSVFNPVSSPMAFGKGDVFDQPVLQNNYVPGDISEQVKVDEPFKSTAFRNDEVSFDIPFKNNQQNSSSSKDYDESGVTQVQNENKEGVSNNRYRQIMNEWRSAEMHRRKAPQSSAVHGVSDSRNRTANSDQAPPQATVNPSWDNENTQPNEASGAGHLTFDGIIDMIKEGRFKKIVTVVGAAFSASAGIPDYRSPESHLHHRISHKTFVRPEDLFHREFFQIIPFRFIDLFKDLLPGKYKPTISHYFIKLLETKGMLLRHYTQNVDSLDRMAGISLDKLVEAHGSFRLQHCSMCRVRHYFSWWREHILANKIPRCRTKRCNWYVVPDVVFFGEQLPQNFYIHMEADYRVADLLIVMGTPLTVRPFAFFYNNFKCPRLVINRENIDKDYLYMQLFGYAQRTRNVDFDPSKNERDVLWVGECDKACEIMAEKLGWTEELKALMEEGHKKLEGKVDVFDENLNS